MTKQNQVSAKKLLQIAAIYIFALIAAVACAPGFHPARVAEPIVKPAVLGPAAEFKPAIKSAKRTALADSVAVEYVILDGGQEITIKTAHTKSQAEAAADSTIEPYVYSVNDLCLDEACSEVAAIVARVNRSVRGPEGVSQSSILLAGSGAELTKVNEAHNTKFDSVSDAAGSLKPTPAPAPKAPSTEEVVEGDAKVVETK